MDPRAAFDARVDELFDRMLDLEPDQRTPALDEACGDDGELRAAVERLLAWSDKPPPALETSALVAAPWATDDDTRPDREDDDAAAVSERIGPYRLLSELGRGGMGVVFLAERDDGHFTQRVALKVMRPGTENVEMRQRFEQERQIIAQLSHPHIARLFDGGVTDDGRPYSAMELVEGVPITEYCDRRQLGIRERLALFGKVGEAVHYAHQHLVVHRDLKPSNILVTEDGDLKLLDFGIAKLLDLSEIKTCPIDGTLTHTGRIPMTPLYASPEQLRGDKVTTASDIYQLGLLLFELITGERARDESSVTPSAGSSPFGFEETPVSAPSSAIKKAPAGRLKISSEARATTPRGLRKELHGDVDTLVLTALHPEVARRYPSAAELVEDVRRFLGGYPLSARRDSVGYRAQRFLRRNRLAVAVAAIFLALLVAYAATVTVQAERVARERDRAESVLAFALSLYGAGDPNEALGPQISAIDLIQRGVERVGTELAGEPHAQADLLAYFGRIYERLGLWTEAEDTLRRALDLQIEIYGEEHPKALETRASLASILVYLRHADAESMLEQTLELHRRVLGDEHRHTATVRRYLGQHYSSVGRYVDAETQLREALDVHRRVAPGSRDLAFTLSDLARPLKRQGQYAEALELQWESAAIQAKHFGEVHPDRVSATNNIADTLWKLERWDEGDATMERSLTLARKLYGDTHRDIATSLGNIGTSMLDRGELEKAADYFRQSLEMRRQLAGGDDRFVAQSSAQLAQVLERLGRLEESEALLLDAMRIFRAINPNAKVDLAKVQQRLAPVWIATGRFEDAERILREAIEAFRTTQGSPWPARLEVLLAESLVGQGRRGEAAPHLDTARRGLAPDDEIWLSRLRELEGR
ncbi:MAG: tetratricopeptide repeat protein [Acidobacteriota bacterium]